MLTESLIRGLWKINLPRRKGLYLKRLAYRKLLGQRRIRVRTQFGVEMMLDPAEIVDGHILTEGYWEPEVLEAIASALGDRDVFWDIGGNLGTHSLTIKKLKPGARVIAFEPNPVMYDLFAAHAKMNGLDVEIHKLGLSDQEGHAEFFVYTGLNYGKSGLHEPSAAEKANAVPIRVELTTGDRLVQKLGVPAPHVIKIDVEGHELFAFRGMTNLLSGPTVRAIVFEDVPVPDSPVKLLLAGYGFRIRELMPPQETGHTDYGDYVAEK